MNPKWRRFAPIGLYLALLAALVAGGLYIVERSWNLPLQISLAVIVIGLAAFAVLDPGRVRQALVGRQARYGSNAAIILIAFAGILIALNYLVYKNDKRWDLTEDKTNSLTPETIATLGKLTDPVAATAYYTKRLSSDQAKKLLDQYVRDSKGKFNYKFVDPEADPVAAQQANITRDGTVVVKVGSHSEQVTTVDEQRMTGALVKLLSGGTKTIYFLTGHGEKSPDDTSEQAYSQAKSTLQGKNYTVKTINLLNTPKIPDDANILVIAGPTDPYLEGEVKEINDFQAKGGAVVFMIEPTVLTHMGDKPDLLVDYLKNSWGIIVGNDVVIDLIGQNQFGQPFMAVGANYASHPIITQEMKSLVTIFPEARSVKAGESISGVTQVEVIKTSDQSWAETDLTSLMQGGQPKADQGVDQIGGIPLVVAAENSNTKARVVAVGDSDFGTNTYQAAYGNPDLLVNIMDWAAGQENLINLTPKPNTTRTLNLPTFPYFTGLLFLVSIIVLPGSALVTGIAVFISRRRRG